MDIFFSVVPQLGRLQTFSIVRAAVSCRTAHGLHRSPVASLGLVSPVAATDGVTLCFLGKKLTTFALWKVMSFLETDNAFLALVSSPLLSSHVVYPVFYPNSATKINFIWVSPPGW